jgi:hypothetical protein
MNADARDMDRQIFYWKPICDKNVLGEDFASQVPDLIARYYRGGLLERILEMPQKEPIPFESAVRLASGKHFEAFEANRMGYKPGECNWFFKYFVEWISSLGYHIELTGDEFEPYLKADKTI